MFGRIREQNVSIGEMEAILVKIKDQHDWPMQGKGIKYVDLCYDQRTMSYFRIRFRGFADRPKVFTSVNRLHEGAENPLTTSLFDEIIDWLDDPNGEWDEVEEL